MKLGERKGVDELERPLGAFNCMKVVRPCTVTALKTNQEPACKNRARPPAYGVGGNHRWKERLQVSRQTLR